MSRLSSWFRFSQTRRKWQYWYQKLHYMKTKKFQQQNVTSSQVWTRNLWGLSLDVLCFQLRAHLHLVIATPLQWCCDIALKSNVCVLSCTVTYSICDCDCNIAGGSLCEWFKSDIAAILESQLLYAGLPHLSWFKIPWHFPDNSLSYHHFSLTIYLIFPR